MAKKIIKQASKRSGKKTLMKKPDILIKDIRQMIDEARHAVAVTVNAALTMLYWKIGKRIYDETLKNKRAAYGEEIIANVSQQLVNEYGKNFTDKNLRRMIQFAEVFNDEQIVVSLIRQLSWTHFMRGKIQ